MVERVHNADSAEPVYENAGPGPDGVLITKDEMINNMLTQFRNIDMNEIYNRRSDNGTFSLRNIEGKRIRIKLEMNNAADEIIVGKMLIERNVVDRTRIGRYADIGNYMQLHFKNAIKALYLENVRYINIKQDDIIRRVEDNKVVQVRNPETRRFIKPDRPAYKRIYGNLELRKRNYKDLSKYETEKYEIIDNCVYDYLKTIDKKLKPREKWVLDDVFEFCEKKKINCIARDIDYEIIRENIIKGVKKELNFIVYDNHFYVLKGKQLGPKRGKYNKITKIEEIDNPDYNNSVLVVETEELLSQVKNKIKETNQLIDYSDDHICYKNKEIRLIDSYESTKKIVDEEKYGSLHVYNCIDKNLNLRGYLDDELFNYFQQANKIRIHSYTENKNNIVFDANKAYQHFLFNSDLKIYNEIEFPVPSLNDNFVQYNGEKIVESNIYYIRIHKPDTILAPNDGVYFGHVVLILQKEKRDIDIEYVFVASEKRVVELSVGKYDFDTTRKYIGWLSKSSSMNEICTELVNKNDVEALQKKYGETIYIKEEKGIYEMVKKETMIIKKTGILTNLLIKELTNINLYNLNKEMKKLNPGIILNTIKTDSLGYIYDKEIKIPRNMVVEKKDVGTRAALGKFKEEIKIINKETGELNITKTYYKNLKNIKTTLPYTEWLAPYIVMDSAKNEYGNDGVDELLEENKSFQLNGRPGYGKTHMIMQKIIPKLTAKNKKVFLTSTTIDNRDDLRAKVKEMNYDMQVETIQYTIENKTVEELKAEIPEGSYIIIDESSQLTQDTYKVLEHLRRTRGVRIILSGDPNQCKSTDAINENWLNTQYVIRLCGNNIVTLQKHDKIRYDSKLDELLTKIETMHNIAEIRKEVYKAIKTTDKVINEINIAYFNKTCANVINIDKQKCYTVHSHQGRTIKEPYSIFNLEMMEKELIYTAISRATKITDITLCTKRYK